MSDDPRIHDAVSAENVRLLLAGTLTDPMPGTLSARVAMYAHGRSAHAFQSGHRFGHDAAMGEVRKAAEAAVASDILKGWTK